MLHYLAIPSAKGDAPRTAAAIGTDDFGRLALAQLWEPMEQQQSPAADDDLRATEQLDVSSAAPLVSPRLACAFCVGFCLGFCVGFCLGFCLGFCVLCARAPAGLQPATPAVASAQRKGVPAVFCPQRGEAPRRAWHRAHTELAALRARARGEWGALPSALDPWGWGAAAAWPGFFLGLCVLAGIEHELQTQNPRQNPRQKPESSRPGM